MKKKPDDDTEDLDAGARRLENELAEIEKAFDALEVPTIRESLDGARVLAMYLYVQAKLDILPPHMVAVADGTLRDFQLWRDTGGFFPAERIEKQASLLFEESIDHHPELADLLRGPRAQRLIRLHAKNSAGGASEAWQETEEAAVAAYARLVAEVLLTRGKCTPSARIIAEELPAYQARLTALEAQLHAREKAETLAREEAEARERGEREALAAEEERRRGEERLRTEDREARDRREGLASHFKRYGAYYVFPVDGVDMDGEACSRALLAGAEFSKFFKAQLSGRRLKGTVNA